MHIQELQESRITEATTFDPSSFPSSASSHLSALNTLGPVQRQALHSRHLLVRTSTHKANRTDPLNLLTDRDAPPALDALVRIKGNGVVGRAFRLSRRLTICRSGDAGPAIPLVVVLKGLADLSRGNILHLLRGAWGRGREGRKV